jgi:hypothetical protein
VEKFSIIQKIASKETTKFVSSKKKSNNQHNKSQENPSKFVEISVKISVENVVIEKVSP